MVGERQGSAGGQRGPMGKPWQSRIGVGSCIEQARRPAPERGSARSRGSGKSAASLIVALLVGGGGQAPGHNETRVDEPGGPGSRRSKRGAIHRSRRSSLARLPPGVWGSIELGDLNLT